METLKELFEQLDYWEQYSPKSYGGSMLKVAKIGSQNTNIRQSQKILELTS